MSIGNFYPNPSKSGIVNLEYTSPKEELLVFSVFDITGQLVMQQTKEVSISNHHLKIDFSNLHYGIYLVKIGNLNNPIHRKLILKR